MSSVHTLEIATDVESGENPPMTTTTRSIAKRLELTRSALNLSSAELCREIKCKPNRWSQYESGDRRITLAIAERLCDQYGVTLDWIYRNDTRLLPSKLLEKLASAATEAA